MNVKALVLYVTTRLFIPDGNIAIGQLNFSQLIENKKSNRDYVWLKHKYRDRFFADPFILKVNNSTIEILAEELKFNDNKGVIVRLIIDKGSAILIERIVVLEEHEHLSYSYIYRADGNVYVIPENNSSGCCKLYKYDFDKDKIYFVQNIVKLPLNDPTVFCNNDKYFCFATMNNANMDLYLNVSSQPFNYDMDFVKIESDKKGARPAGRIIEYENNLYRPTQDCSKVYGGKIIFQKIGCCSKSGYQEDEAFIVSPVSKKYNIGTHHIDFYDGWSVCV